MIQENNIYEFKKEFCAELNIPMNQAERQLDRLLIWLKNFYDYDFIKGRPYKIFIKTIYGEYFPMPRKVSDITPQKFQDYKDFTIAALGTEYKPNSKIKVARDAIESFGYKKYHHTNYKAVTERYIRKPFNEYGETNDQHYWVWFSSYKKLNKEEENNWRGILYEEEIEEQKAANAFYKQAEGEDITEELNRYKKAQNRSLEEYGDFPVRVREWRVKETF